MSTDIDTARRAQQAWNHIQSKAAPEFVAHCAKAMGHWLTAAERDEAACRISEALQDAMWQTILEMERSIDDAEQSEHDAYREQVRGDYYSSVL